MQVNEELKEFLRSQGFAVLCMELDLGQGGEAVVVVKSTSDVVSGLRERNAPVEVGWRVGKTPWGPVVCLALRCRHPEVGELAGETYFDVAADSDRQLLERFGSQGRLRVAFLDEELSPVWLAEVPWDEVRQLEARQVADRAEELLERAEEVDFDSAKEFFQQEQPLDRLLSSLFSE